MKVKVAIYKQGFLSEEQRNRINEKAAGLGLVEAQGKEAADDMEMVVYLKWLSKRVSELDDKGKGELRKFIREHQENENPLIGFLVSRYGQEKLMEGVGELVNEVVGRK